MHGSSARFNQSPFKVLTVDLSASFSVVSSPSGNTTALEAFVHNILAASEVSIAKLVDTVPTCDVRVCNSYNPVWIAPSMICYFCSNYCRASVVTSLTVSPMSYKYPSVSVMGSSEFLVALDFFLNPPFSCSLGS